MAALVGIPYSGVDRRPGFGLSAIRVFHPAAPQMVWGMDEGCWDVQAVQVLGSPGYPGVS